MYVGTYRRFAHPMSMITTVGKHTHSEMETGGQLFVGLSSPDRQPPGCLDRRNQEARCILLKAK